jgi:Trk K+ transport system NAD-binding subunit
MPKAKRRFLTLVAFLPVVVLGSAWLYMVGMARLEGTERSFWQALAFFGVLLIYIVVPIYLIQFLEERFESRLPRQAPKMRDHVIIYRYGAPVETLVEELTQLEVPVVVVEHDRDLARNLRDRKVPVVYSDAAGPSLSNVYLEKARALIANGSDEENAAVILVARQLGFEGQALALVEDPFHRKPIMLAGANAVLTPRHVLGAALAARASHRISPRVSGLQQLGRKLEVAEIRIDPGSPLAGQTLAGAAVGARTGTVVIGQWVEGHLEPQPAAGDRLLPRGILVAVGSAENLARLSELAGAVRPQESGGPFLVAGYGEVGKKVAQLLRDVGELVQVVDLQEGEGVDHAGDVLDPRLLESVEVARARAVVLALDNDRATLFATVVIKDLAPEVPIIARVNAAENVERIHRAGAEFALSISQVSGKILAARLLREEAVELDTRLRLLKVVAPRLAGHHPAELDVRERIGCSVVAVERGDDAIVEFGPDFRFRPDDAIYVCGTREATHRFAEEYG